MALKLTHDVDLHDIAKGKDLAELHMTPEGIAAIKLSYLELIAKVTVDKISGVEETGLERVTKKAYDVDPQLTKAFFGIEATRKFDISEKTGLRKKNTKNSSAEILQDDLAFIDASMNQAIQRGREARLQAAPVDNVSSKSKPKQTSSTRDSKADHKETSTQRTSPKMNEQSISSTGRSKPTSAQTTTERPSLTSRMTLSRANSRSRLAENHRELTEPLLSTSSPLEPQISVGSGIVSL